MNIPMFFGNSWIIFKIIKHHLRISLNCHRQQFLELSLRPCSERLPKHVGDLRIWRSRRRENFDQRELDILALVRPAMTRALERAEAQRPSAHVRSGRASELVRRLSPREAQVAQLVSEGLADKEIARTLRVSVTTVRTHIERLFGKLGVHKRSAVGMALQRHA